MSSFKDFWASTEDSDTSSGSVITQMSQGITAIVGGAGFFSFLGGNKQQVQAEKFSNDVTKYATSDEVISELSNVIGEPRLNETEDEFVCRASTALRAILRKKFKI